MLIKIAWKNIWRNKSRSIVVICAVALGLWAGVFASAFVQGMMVQKVDSVIRMEISHVQFHHPEFMDEKLPQYFIEDGDAIIESIKEDSAVTGVAARLVAMAMIASPNASGAVRVSGVKPEDESIVTELDKRVIEGEYLDAENRNPVLISQKTAEEYKLKLRSKLVLTFQDVNQEITAGAFRVSGIFQTNNSMYDKANVFVRVDDIRKLMGVERGYHEIAVLLDDHDLADPMAIKYQSEFPNIEIKAWPDLSTGMRYMIDAFDVYLYFIVGIILVALILSIINTMLMAVLERTREIGMLMAIGMNKLKVFKMILWETLFLSMIGGPLGLFLSWITIAITARSGINLAGAAYSDLGFSSVIYPYLEMQSYIDVTLMVLVMAILAAFYPAWKALRLRPVEAIRKI